MFAWRKRKLQDEEPLVPHGLIWQATEDPMLPPGTKQSAHPDSDDSPISRIPPRREGAPATPLASGNLALKPEQDPQTLPWSSLNVEGAIRKPAPHPEDISFWRTPSKPLTTESPKAIQSFAPSASGEQELRSTEVTPPAATSVNEATLRNTVRALRREVNFAWGETMHALAVSLANGKHAYSSWGVQRRFEKMRQEAAARAAVLRLNVARSTQAAAKKTSELPGLFRKVTLGPNASLRLNTGKWLQRSGRLSRKMFSHRVTIRIATNRRMLPLIEKLQEAHLKSREALNRNWRLATSVSMAALSALLTLGLILLVSRYQPTPAADDKAGPVQVLNVSAPVSKEQAVPVSAKSTLPKPPAMPASRITPNQVNTALHVSDVSTGSSATHRSAVAHRTHRNADEDYVARDTYVYYGAKGKTSR